MIKLYSNENFPQKVVELLREKGYYVLTTKDAGKAGVDIPDEEVLAFAIQENRYFVSKDTHNTSLQDSENVGAVVSSP